MISLFPDGSDEPFDPVAAVAAEERAPHADRPWVMTNMIASADGATAVGGQSGPLGGPADKAMFAALRSVADAIVVGASTVREERYRPPGLGTEAARSARAALGAPERPVIAVVSGSLSFDLDLPLFTEPGYRPLILTAASAPAERRERLEEVADLIEAGEERVDLSVALGALRERGHAIALAEGGPRLNAQLIVDGLIDEWNLSLSPLLAAGSSQRPATGDEPSAPPARMNLTRVWEQDQLLFCRWVSSARRA